MKRLMMLIGLLSVLTGCASHYYRIQDGQLALYLDRPDAREVILASSLDGFQPHEARKVAGRWVVSLPSDRAFRYYYMLDGQVFLPPCRMKERDDFGSENCVFEPPQLSAAPAMTNSIIRFPSPSASRQE